MPATKSYQERVKEEKKQLDERLEKLQGFAHTQGFTELPVLDQCLLYAQLGAMRQYTSILSMRINTFG